MGYEEIEMIEFIQTVGPGSVIHSWAVLGGLIGVPTNRGGER